MTADTTAEKAIRAEAEARYPRLNADMMRSNMAFVAGAEWGRASRDIEVAELARVWGVAVEYAESLREQLGEARAEIERRPEPAFRDALIADRNRAESALAEAQATIAAAVKAYKDGPIAFDQGFKIALDMFNILSAPSSTGGGDMSILSEQQLSDLGEILRLHDEAFQHYLKDDPGHKSSEGALEVSFGNFFDRDAYDEAGKVGAVGVCVYSYALGPSRSHYFDSIEDALAEVRRWHAEEMSRELWR